MTGRRPALGADVDHDQAAAADAIAEAAADAAEAMAEHIARRVAEQLAPGMGSMILPEWAGEALAEAYPQLWYAPPMGLGNTGHVLQLRYQADPKRRQLLLFVDVDGRSAWAGTLRVSDATP